MTMLSGTSSKTRIAILMTCFNRCAVTLGGLASLQQQTGLGDCELAIYLVDDGSKDGTADAVQQQFPAVHLLRGDGSLFWNGGMRRAFAAAISTGYDSYLWFNDDTVLAPDAIHRLLATARAWEQEHGPAIVVGSVQDAGSGKHTYGGFIMQRHGLSMGLESIPPHTHKPLACDSMNGNFVLIPSEIVAVLGNLEARFRHQIGDVDYGLRARAAGFDVVLAPGYFGHCSNNSSKGTWRDRSMPFKQRWKNLMSPKGAPMGEWLLYTRRHYGWRWPLYFASPYVKTVLTSLMPGRGNSAAS
jgi:GT2 family glycosyltransferase